MNDRIVDSLEADCDVTLYRTVLYQVQDRVARITLNRPQVRNGLDREMTLELREAVVAAEEDPQVGALLLTGAGSAFCSGADLGAVNIDPSPDKRAKQGRDAEAFVREAINPLMSTLYACSKPLVVAVNGPAVGGGIGLALVADIVLAGESARFLPKFTPQLALIPDLGSTWSLPRLIGRQRTSALALLGDTLTAHQAESWGLVWACYPDDCLLDEATTMARRLAYGPSFAMSAVKQALRSSPLNTFDEQLDLEKVLSETCCASADFCEAADAFLTKRAPIFGAFDESLKVRSPS